MRTIKLKPMLASVLAAGAIVLSPHVIHAAESTTWLDYVAAKDAGTEPNMPDFSYAGYHRGEDPIPVVNHTVFDVTQAPYNAVPDDQNDDTAAIQAAIDDAEANGSGIVFLPKGRYIATGLVVNGNNIVVRGEGALPGGTEIFGQAQGQMITFKPFSTGNKSTITTVTGNAARETFELQVADVSALSVGQMVSLYSRDPNINLLNEFFAPFTPAGSETLSKGVQVNSRHVITAINGNTLTFAEPIHYDVNANYAWEIRKPGNYLTEVGLEDIALVGNFTNDTTFVHHRSTVDDSGWKGARFSHIHNSWARRVRVTDANHGIDVVNAVNSSLFELILDGNNGHHGLLVNASNRVMVGLVQERNIWEHPAGQTGPNAGNVFWHYDAREVMDIDNHGKYGYATLRDNVSAHNPGNGSGSASQSPRHLRHYTLWNYTYKYSGPAATQTPHNFWASIFSSIVQPTVVGFQTPGLSQNMLVTTATDHASTASSKPVYNTMAVNESYGNAVTPASLYEAQLGYRLPNPPLWTLQYKQDWQQFSNTTVTMDSNLDNAVFASGANVNLSASVPAELSDVSQVEFYHGATLLGADVNAPYSFNWAAPSDGTYAITARVVRAGGEYGDSHPVTLFVGTESTSPLSTSIVQALTDQGSTSTVLDTQPSSHLIDDDLSTYWTSNAAKRKPNNTRTPQSFDLDLGSVKAVNRVDIAWHQGDVKANYFRVHVSTDNTNWTEVLRAMSSGNSTALETYYFDSQPAQFVRVIGFTNSYDRGVAISEVDVYAEDSSTTPPPPPPPPTSGATQGISFDGIDDYIELADIDYGSSERITVAMWVKFTNVPATSFILRKANTSSNNPYYIQASTNGKISARVNGINGGISGLDDGQWHHIAMTYQGSSEYLRTYVDGVLVAENEEVEPADDNNILVTLGGASNGSYSFKGSVDDLRIYDRKLSDSEIAALAAAPHLNESDACAIESGDSNLRGFWRFADGGTTTTCDSSGNGNHGILHNNPTWN